MLNCELNTCEQRLNGLLQPYVLVCDAGPAYFCVVLCRAQMLGPPGLRAWFPAFIIVTKLTPVPPSVVTLV